MNLRNNKGVTGVDLSVSIVIIVLFVGLIASLVYNFGVASKGVNRTSIATNIAISKIEQLKSEDYEDLQGKTTEYKDENGVTQENAPYKVTTEIIKYSESDYVKNLSEIQKEELQDVIKIVKVIVEYKVGNRNESIDINTVITKEN